MMKYLALVLALVACKKPDDCTRLFDVMSKTVPDPRLGGAKEKFLEQCRKDPKYLDDPMAKCVLAAANDQDATACLKKGFEDYLGKSKATEAGLVLNKLAKNAKRAAIETGSFPQGKAKTLPDVPTCCGGDKGKCAPTNEWANDPIWRLLDFSIDEPTLFRYSYESPTGKTFTALAVGDADCDGKLATYTLTGKIDESGGPATVLTRPPEGIY